jgi:hypothetical protein
MFRHRTRERDLLGELLEEARWVERIGEAGRVSVPARVPELDAMLEALMKAQMLRRQLTERLAREREAAQGCDWGPEDARGGSPPDRRQGEREAS